jgi:hypothetical protein
LTVATSKAGAVETVCALAEFTVPMSEIAITATILHNFSKSFEASIIAVLPDILVKRETISRSSTIQSASAEGFSA